MAYSRLVLRHWLLPSDDVLHHSLGWMLDYFYKFTVGAFDGAATDAVDGVFSLCWPIPEMAVFMVIIVLAGFLVCSFGLQKGLERISKWMMLALLALIVVSGSSQPHPGRRHGGREVLSSAGLPAGRGGGPWQWSSPPP